MPKRPKSRKLPTLTQKQQDFFHLYRRLECELGRAPMLRELGEEAGYSEGSETAGAQRMLDKLVELGVVEKPVMQPVGGGTTALGLQVLKTLGEGD